MDGEDFIFLHAEASMLTDALHPGGKSLGDGVDGSALLADGFLHVG